MKTLEERVTEIEGLLRSYNVSMPEVSFARCVMSEATQREEGLPIMARAQSA